MPGNHGFITGDAGVFSGNATLNLAGPQTITVTDTGNGSLTATASISVNAGAAAYLVLSGPGSISSGSPFTITVTAFDNLNNVANGYAGTIMFSSSDGTATLPANHTFTIGDGGTFSSSATLFASGPQTITVMDLGNASLMDTAHISINSLIVDHLTITPLHRVQQAMPSWLP